MKYLTGLLTILLLGNSLVYAEPVSAANTQRQIDTLSITLQQYTDTDALTRYHAYKAKMWLSYAVNQQSERSLSIAGREALQQAQRIVTGLQSKQNLSLTTPILSVSQVMRRDLWWQVEHLKQQGAIDKAPESLAHAEVMLVWAAAEYCELGWRHAQEPFNAVQQALYQVVESTSIRLTDTSWQPEQLSSLQQLNGKGCHGVNSEFWPLAKVQSNQQSNSLKINNIVHFAQDSADLSPASQTVLQQWGTQLKQYPQLSVVLKGYTDRHASPNYNIQLAQRRVQAVQDYLVVQGMDITNITTEAKGAVDFQTDREMKIAEAKSRRVVLQVADAPGIEIKYLPQWQDLQIESKQQKVKVK
ncbi:MAG: OmpA family protein [Acinetobacter sp.]|uniref:Outer membrane protein OmpA-like peptidoglycan-associated protein n=1 Tax=Acinetobacter lwoffii TaxID=28090 RepID=A0AAW3VK11_ACILW|nr:OmpA family protein [Acinetobacter lwoffii]MBB6364739.1 outer membrane protein OmpA-like peptidoglycan-associated protein [Acinetobacter lwoffii]MCJ8512627.1 OmpA family protein [Acinetobacter lwoffii]